MCTITGLTVDEMQDRGIDDSARTALSIVSSAPGGDEEVRRLLMKVVTKRRAIGNPSAFLTTAACNWMGRHTERHRP